MDGSQGGLISRLESTVRDFCMRQLAANTAATNNFREAWTRAVAHKSDRVWGFKDTSGNTWLVGDLESPAVLEGEGGEVPGRSEGLRCLDPGD